MRVYFSLLLLIFSKINAQTPDERCKQVNDIAAMEAFSNARVNTPNLSFSSNNFDVKYYRCEWQIDPTIRSINGKVTAYYNITAATTSISFDMVDALIADSVKQRNNPLAFQHTNNVLQVNFSTTVPVSTLDSISIFYHGIPPLTGFGSFIQSSHAGVPVIWTLSEPYGSRDWWPCKNGLDDKTDSIDVIVTHPSIYKAASNGLLQSETPSGPNTVTHWKHRYPIATYLVCMAVTNYSVFNTSVLLGSRDLPMQTFCYPENLALFQANTPLVLAAMQFYNSVFGDYPFIKEKYGHVQFGFGGGQEHQTSTFIVTPNEGLLAHELGHQWFGDKITCGSWEDTWLNEGFATHLASMYAEQKYPAQTLSTRKAEIANITSVPGGSVWVDDTSNVNRIFSSRLTYTKGSHLLYMLRWILGDSIFLKGIKQYLGDPKLAYGFAKTADLQRNLEQVSGRDLSYFFKEWFYGQGYPTFNVQWSQLGSSYVKIKMNQSTSDPSVNLFELPVALQFKNATQQKTIIVDNKINGQVLYSNIGFVADTVIIDPDYWLVTANNISQKIPDSTGGQNSVLVFPNPVQTQLYVYLRNFLSTSAFLELYNSGGQLLYKNLLFINGSEFIGIPFSQWAAGTYFIKVTSGNTSITKRIIK